MSCNYQTINGNERRRSRLIYLPIFLLLTFGVSWGARFSTGVQTELTSLQAIQSIDNVHAIQGIPASFDATVTYSRGYQRLLFVQDKDAAIFIAVPDTTTYVPGDRVHIVGKTAPSFRPIIVADEIRVIGRDRLPDAAPAQFSQLAQSQFDARRVQVRARVRAADFISSGTKPIVRSAILQLAMTGGQIEAYVDSDDRQMLEGLLDAEVEITGVAAGKFDDKMQLTGVVVYVSKLSGIRVIERAKANLWSLDPIPMGEILSAYHVEDLSKRVRVVGTITYYQPGSAVILESGKQSLWIATHTHDPLQVGDIATATGFPDAQNRMLSLVDGEVHDTAIQDPITPHPATWQQLALWDSSKPVGHQYDLVSTEGEVIAEVRDALQDRYLISADGHLFTAIYRHARDGSPLPAMRTVPLNSKIRVTGICSITDTNVVRTGEEAPFDLLMRSYDDIEVIGEPPILNVRNLMLLVGFLMLLLFAGGILAWIAERRARYQTASTALIERKRARVLEDINGTRPLAEIIEDITQLVSTKLKGFPCWCQMTDGARIGVCPTDPGAFRIVEQKINNISGTTLGTLSVALELRSQASNVESETLVGAAAIAVLAIETRRLYSDLVHRSEFDQLTQIHNRFSFERCIELQIEEAHQRAGVFGLIYVDLNDFKQVNDNYGHQVGDLLLSQVAARMKQRLRGRDILARLGGDEFAILLPTIRNRTEIDEVARRLEQAFAELFELDSYLIPGSASFGCAMYPEDGKKKDELLNAADASMYVDKQTKKEARALQNAGNAGL